MAALTSSLAVDPSKPAKFPISINEQLLREDGPRKRRRVNVQFNHKPKLSNGSTKSTIAPSSHGAAHGYNVSVADENNRNLYRYVGNQHNPEATALIYNSVNGSFMLDRIDTEFRFNLQSTPTNNDSASLASQYPHLDTGLQETEEDVQDNLFDEHSEGHDPDAEPPDPKNPYDYRHFLKSSRLGRSPSPEPSVLGSSWSARDVNPSPNNTNSSLARQPHSSRPARRRSHPKPRHLSPNPREEADADNEDSEADDVLTIDMGDSTITNNRPWRSVLGNLNEGGRSSGPISLRSAASSMSPSLRGDSDNDDDERSNTDVEEIDLGDGGYDIGSQDAMGEEVQTPGAESEDDEDPFAAQLENQLIAEAMSEAEQEHGDIKIVGEYEHTNGLSGVVEHPVFEESSEESEEE